MVAGCGGDGAADSSTPSSDVATTAAPAETTTPPDQTTTTSDVAGAGEGQGTELCEVVGTSLSGGDEVDVFDPEAFEASSLQNLQDLEELQAVIPAEIDDDFALVLEANREFVTLLEEYNWVILDIPEDEPRMLRMSSDGVLAASRSILDFCGLDVTS